MCLFDDDIVSRVWSASAARRPSAVIVRLHDGNKGFITVEGPVWSRFIATLKSAD